MQSKTNRSFSTHFKRSGTLLVFTLACFWLISCSARADAHNTVRMDEARSGSLLFRTPTPGQFIPAPILATDVQLEVTGPVIRARVTQKFTNTSDQWVEGLYLFPLPDEAAVDTLVMMVGSRVIEGKIQERQQARKTYETAVKAGKKAALVEQERPNMFLNSVANIGPGETVIVQIEYQDKVQIKDNIWSLHFPLVVAPRFSPTKGQLDSTLLMSAAPAPMATLAVTLKPGFAVQEITSPSHNIIQQGQAISLDASVPANKDFILNWSAKSSPKPLASLYSQQVNGQTYVLAMVQAPTGMGETATGLAKEMVYVIDNSGSMAGVSIRQARTALLQSLEQLRPNDLFNVIRFDDETDLLFPDSVMANANNLQRAKTFVASLAGDGGTVMLPALQAALNAPNPDPLRVRQVVFITDGQISNEAELFAAISKNLGDSRLFVVGIGSAPNRYFVSRAARLGRGTDLVIADLDEVAEKMARFLSKLDRPAMRDIAASFVKTKNSQIWPNPVPDLYFNEPLMILAKLSDADDTLTLSGGLGKGNWTAKLDLSNATQGKGIATLWARAKIRNLEEGRFTDVPTDTIDAGILATALEHHLVSRLTSLVAVDVTPSRPKGQPLDSASIPLLLPEGWGALETTMSAVPKSVPVSSARARRGVMLPATASPLQVQIILGLLLLALALAFSSKFSPRRPRS
ncbi:Inter-alpha-trypsin inhibitor domain protein [hydrothermal vent metagenome]|uniref:Inter-alpha-trypsin inhibitor domain protein n=1 Tax=hydrothermal vent metagenome TaxID=652676 RepID=A0A3B0RTE1_9ZZZZ